MLKALKRVIYKVSDLENAKQWYAKVLNMQPLFDTPFFVIFNIGDCTLSLSKSDEPVSRSIERTEIYWEVDNIDNSYQRLIELGATPHTPIKEVLNIRVAKVIDPFGNIIGLSGSLPDIEERTVDKRPSETAMIVAFCRALAAKDDREEIKGPDYLAELFLTEDAKKPLSDAASRKWAIQNLATSPLYGYLISRTAFIDNVFKKALAEKIPQVVILGAGYDTRAYRFADLIGDTRIFEVDAIATQNRKIEIIKSAGISIPQQLTFISINFKKERLDEVLTKSGYNNALKTLFIWEGVSYYLQEEAVKSTLAFINSHAPDGSMICFDYMTEKIKSVNPAEPFLFWIKPEELAPFLSDLGFKILEHFDSTKMEQTFLTLGNGSQAEKTLPHFCLVTAIVRKG